VPWMLEAAIVLELALDKYVEATIIAGLLVFNGALGLFQESRAQATLAALKSRLGLNASVRRDGAWKPRLIGTIFREPAISNGPIDRRSVREVIELCRSRDLEQGFEFGLYNRGKSEARVVSAK
jgi:hypothetical protein